MTDSTLPTPVSHFSRSLAFLQGFFFSIPVKDHSARKETPSFSACDAIRQTLIFIRQTLTSKKVTVLALVTLRFSTPNSAV